MTDTPFTIDETTTFGARAATRLREEVVAWFITVSPSGAPSANPVWFRWDGADGVVGHSLPDAARVRHVAAEPRVSLHFDSNGQGGDIVVLSALAQARPDDPRADQDPAYVAKYADHFTRIGLTPATFALRYSLPITLTLTGLRGH